MTMTLPPSTLPLTLATIPELPALAWLILAVLAYLLVTCVLNALAVEVRNERERHDLIIQARQRRIEYRRKGQRIGKAGG